MLLAGLTYPARILTTSWIVAKSGAPGLNIKCAVTDPDGAEVELFGTVYFTERSAAMARRQLKNCGFDPDKNSSTEIGKSISLAGLDVEGGVTLDEYNGNVKIGFFGGKSAPTPAALAGIDALLRAAKKSNPLAEPAGDLAEPSAPAPRPKEDASSLPAEEPPFAADDGQDIPF